MARFAIYYELDEAGRDTGRVQVVEEGEDLVFNTYSTEEEAEKKMVRMQSEANRDDTIEVEYLKWETACLERHNISKEELRILLVNVVII